PTGGAGYTAMETVLTDWAADSAAGSSSSSSSGGTGSSSSGSSSSGGTGCGSSSSSSSSSSGGTVGGSSSSSSSSGSSGVAGGSSSGGGSFPLLGSSHGGHLWGDYCANNGNPLPDSAVLPQDPRKLVVPGANQNKAVYFNVYWEECRSKADPTYTPPQTCGVYRQQVAEGATLIEGDGAVGAGAAAGADQGDALFALPASEYNNLWKVWGLPGRPTNFDQLVAQRYGFPLSPRPNPYPLPGEDPNKTNGGSGQLPMAFTQLRQTNGTWTGKMGVTCHACHSGQIGTAADGPGLGAIYGVDGQSDLGVLIHDFAGGLGGLLPITDNKTRGSGDVTNYQALVMLWLIGDTAADKGITLSSFIFAGATGTEDSPLWWNTGHRPVKFYTGAMPTDATRIMLQAYMPLLVSNAGYNIQNIETWTDAHDRQTAEWVASVKAPSYPYGYCSNADGTPGPSDNPNCINTPLAQQGAILFHTKNLWDSSLNNTVPKPAGGNGSCASCHGAYSPQFVNDPSFLDAPALEGIAAYRVPKNVIGTDPAYIAAENQGVINYFKYSWLFYPPKPGATGACYGGPGTENLQDVQGYVAPPLYGIWASGPYFHNGSVPSVWDVLKPSDRPTIWRRVSTPAPSGQSSKVVEGYDTDLARAYDPENLGWKYDTLTCGTAGVTPYMDCNPKDPNAATVPQELIAILNASIGLSWNISVPVFSEQQIQDRKIYNTHVFSQGNEGHAFTSVLTDAERKALIEYLKTL
ncbi:MAG: hypothetical protein P4L83_00015, partial [Nevskia sp.]|nr:hypothetical protein [Nevskia sp.]